MRAVLGVIIGYALWTAIWLGGNAMFFGDAAEVVQSGEAYTEVGPLVAVVGLSIVCSLIGGFATVAIARKRGAAYVLAFLLLATGIGVQAGVWSLMPVWYHLAFLALLVPVVLFAARIAPAPKPA